MKSIAIDQLTIWGIKNSGACGLDLLKIHILIRILCDFADFFGRYLHLQKAKNGTDGNPSVFRGRPYATAAGGSAGGRGLLLRDAQGGGASEAQPTHGIHGTLSHSAGSMDPGKSHEKIWVGLIWG